MTGGRELSEYARFPSPEIAHVIAHVCINTRICIRATHAIERRRAPSLHLAELIPLRLKRALTRFYGSVSTILRILTKSSSQLSVERFSSSEIICDRLENSFPSKAKTKKNISSPLRSFELDSRLGMKEKRRKKKNMSR